MLRVFVWTGVVENIRVRACVCVCACPVSLCVRPVATQPYLTQPSGFRSLACQRQIALSLPQHPFFFLRALKASCADCHSRKSSPDKCTADRRDWPSSLSPLFGLYFITLLSHLQSKTRHRKHPFHNLKKNNTLLEVQGFHPEYANCSNSFLLYSLSSNVSCGGLCVCVCAIIHKHITKFSLYS